MTVELAIMLDSLRGRVAKGQWYFRRYRNKIIAQHCPTFTKPPSESQLAARQRFAATWGQRYKKHDTTCV